MAFVLEDRVVETANNPGQGDFELLGAVDNSRTFVAAIGNGNTTRYLAVGAEGWEIGVAQVSAGSPDRLLRPGTVTKNSDGTTAPVNFTGTVTVACIASVEDVLWLGENGDLPARSGRDLGTDGDRWRNLFLSNEAHVQRVILEAVVSQIAALGEFIDFNPAGDGSAVTARFFRGSPSDLSRYRVLFTDGTVTPWLTLEKGDGVRLAAAGGRFIGNGSGLTTLGPAAVGAVSESGGSPTGAVVESGSSGNGDYVRFADGTQICTRRANVDLSTGSFATNTFEAAASFAVSNIAAAYCYDGTSTNAAILSAFSDMVLRTSRSGNAMRWQVSVRSQTEAVEPIALLMVGRWY